MDDNMFLSKKKTIHTSLVLFQGCCPKLLYSGNANGNVFHYIAVDMEGGRKVLPASGWYTNDIKMLFRSLQWTKVAVGSECGAKLQFRKDIRCIIDNEPQILYFDFIVESLPVTFLRNSLRRFQSTYLFSIGQSFPNRDSRTPYERTCP